MTVVYWPWISFADLLLGGRDDARVAVPGARHADPGGEVEVAAVVLVVEVDALAARRDHGGRLFQDRGQLGHRCSSGSIVDNQSIARTAVVEESR